MESVHKTVAEMVQDRHYIATDIPDVYTFSTEDAPDIKKIKILFTKITVGVLKEIDESDIDIYIIVLSAKPSPQMVKIVKLIRKTIELFHQEQLSFNITQHIFVPKHTLLSEHEKRIALHDFGCSAGKFPKIKTTDPISRYFGANRGQMFKIEREDGITYRVVD